MFSNYVLNTYDGLTYKVTSPRIQTRNRLQVKGTTVRKVRHIQVTRNHLRPMTEFESTICMAAEQIIRNKKAMTPSQATIVHLSRVLKKQVMA